MCFMGEIETSGFKNLELKKREITEEQRSAEELMENSVEDICIEA